ncbi:decarboxylase [Limnospira sp. PMC 1245.20]|uniref:diaminopimelate decarboxylase family protein n=1 Tax=Limnospira sp. PMC 1245.20 TaxID=2981043 RepID=UPI0028E12B48|nr:decarboxylase [Limnospira sp. PMC 1245.20]MDT9193609.1 decarboxylase [Limnospira sp. PMC 1245.20]
MNITEAKKINPKLSQKLPFSTDLAKKLLDIYGSPLYVYNADILQDTINHIGGAVNYPKTRFKFASVTNGNIALLKIFQQANWGLHANTPGDAFLGLKAGFHPQQIVYSGSNLNHREFQLLLNWGITTYNLDSLDQLQLFGEVFQQLKLDFLPKLGFRLNLPEINGDSRIGVNPQEFPEAIKIAASAGLKITGLHFYRGTGTNATSSFTQVIKPLLAIGQQLPDWQYLDFGGGFGYPYQHQKSAFDWHFFGQQITAELTQINREINREIDLIIEPGRSAIASCGTLLTQVVSTKWQPPKQIVGVDTTVANLSVPSVYGNYREIVSFSDTPNHYITDVCGNTTYSRDYLGKNRQLPQLKRGDILAILDCGAYGYAMSSHFLHRPRPAEVLLQQGKHQLIRQREDYNILLTQQVDI